MFACVLFFFFPHHSFIASLASALPSTSLSDSLVTLSVNRSERQFQSYKLQSDQDFMPSRASFHLSFPVFTKDSCMLILYSWAFKTLR